MYWLYSFPRPCWTCTSPQAYWRSGRESLWLHRHPMQMLTRGARRGISSIPAAISASAHVSSAGAVRAAPLLRLLDSSLWHLPSYFELLVGDPSHDAFCVAQSVRVEADARVLCAVPFAVGSNQLQLRTPINDGPAALLASTWAEAFGASSMTFGAAVTTEDGRCVCSALRKFVRVSAGQPVPWTDDEQAKLSSLVAVDVPEARHLTTSSIMLPALDRLREPTGEQVPRSVFRAPILPSMLGVGGHFDHAAVLEMACDAHLLAGGTDGGAEGTYFSACINYSSAAAVGDIVDVIATANQAKVVALRNAHSLETIAIADFGPR